MLWCGVYHVQSNDVRVKCNVIIQTRQKVFQMIRHAARVWFQKNSLFYLLRSWNMIGTCNQLNRRCSTSAREIVGKTTHKISVRSALVSFTKRAAKQSKRQPKARKFFPILANSIEKNSSTTKQGVGSIAVLHGSDPNFIHVPAHHLRWLRPNRWVSNMQIGHNSNDNFELDKHSGEFYSVMPLRATTTIWSISGEICDIFDSCYWHEEPANSVLIKVPNVVQRENSISIIALSGNWGRTWSRGDEGRVCCWILDAQ